MPSGSWGGSGMETTPRRREKETGRPWSVLEGEKESVWWIIGVLRVGTGRLGQPRRGLWRLLSASFSLERLSGGRFFLLGASFLCFIPSAECFFPWLGILSVFGTSLSEYSFLFYFFFQGFPFLGVPPFGEVFIWKKFFHFGRFFSEAFSPLETVWYYPRKESISCIIQGGLVIISWGFIIQGELKLFIRVPLVGISGANPRSILCSFLIHFFLLEYNFSHCIIFCSWDGIIFMKNTNFTNSFLYD